jgi:hypothetical protein
MSAVSTAKERTKAWGFVDEMRRQIPSDDLVYQIDASGFTAYWSGKNVLNGDGLVNDSAYANRLLARQLDGYLEQNRVCWVVRTARVTPGDPKLLLDYRGLVVRKDEATRVFPEGRIRKSQTELWRMNRCNGTPPTLREVQVEESTF